MRLLRLFSRNVQGSIAVTSALLFTVLIGFAAMGVDVGAVYTDRRKAQSVADLAAMAAVSDLVNADKAAAGTIAKNKLSNASYVLQYGTYTPNPALTPQQRFVPGTKATANAARVVLQSTTPLFFGKVITGKENFPVQTEATATQSSFASFSIGSRLLSVNGGLLNNLLGGLLGTTLSLTAMDYNALLGLKLDAFDFISALATKLSLTGVSYDTILNTEVKVGTIIEALVEAGRLKNGTSDTAVQALISVALKTAGLSEKIDVRALLDLGPYAKMTVGEKPKVSTNISAFDLLSAVGGLANGQNQLALGINAGIPGVASVTVKLAIGERPQGTSWVTVGAVGASVHTAQTRLLVTVSLVGTPPYSVVSLPLYVEVASGTATLSALKCGFPDISTSTATLSVKPGLVDAWIGDVSPSQFTNFVNPPMPAAATLVNVLNLIKVTASAHVSVGNMAATAVPFTYADMQAQTKKTVTTTNITSSLLTSLLGNTAINVNVLGILGIGIGGGTVSNGITSLLNSVASPVDALLASLLQTLGVGLGQADVWMSGIRCDGAVLVM